MAHLYKSRLQNYAQKRSIPFPIYTCETQGPPHARLFKATVTIDGVSYEGPEFCTTLKDAEHAAAKVAFTSLLPAEAQEDDCLYKSLLQELAQKQALVLPAYVTSRTGPPHMPCFVSIVEVAGSSYKGLEARTKKQAEMNAAKVAYVALTQGGPQANSEAVSSNIQMVKASSFGSSSLKPVTEQKESNLVSSTNTMQTSIKIEANYSPVKEAEKEKGEPKEKHMLPLQPMEHESQPNPTPNVVDATQETIKLENLSIQDSQAHEGVDSNGKGNQSSSSNDGALNPSVDPSLTRQARTKVVVRPHKPGMKYDGPILFADDEYVAMTVDIDYKFP